MAFQDLLKFEMRFNRIWKYIDEPEFELLKKIFHEFIEELFIRSSYASEHRLSDFPSKEKKKHEFIDIEDIKLAAHFLLYNYEP